MPHEQPHPSAPRPLSPTQAARLEFARHELDSFRVQELEQARPARLVLMIVRLRTRLDDIVQLVHEISDDSEQI